jgi:hypothetical protein
MTLGFPVHTLPLLYLIDTSVISKKFNSWSYGDEELMQARELQGAKVFRIIYDLIPFKVIYIIRFLTIKVFIGKFSRIVKCLYKDDPNSEVRLYRVTGEL